MAIINMTIGHYDNTKNGGTVSWGIRDEAVVTFDPLSPTVLYVKTPEDITIKGAEILVASLREALRFAERYKED